MELRTLLSTAVGRLSVRAADRRLDRRQRVSRPRTPPRSCRERARVAAHQCRRPRAPAAQINRRCPSSLCVRGSVFRVVRRLGFGVKITPNRISICASRRIRRYMIVLGFDDPRNSDLSTQRHNGRWPMAPWRQWHARVRRRRAAARARMKPARLSPAPYMPGPTPDVPWDPPTSAGRPARTELICLVMRTRGSLDVIFVNPRSAQPHTSKEKDQWTTNYPRSTAPHVEETRGAPSGTADHAAFLYW